MKLSKFSKWLGICLVILVAIIVVPKVFPGLKGNYVWLIILLCPLMHIFMMGGHQHGGNDNHDNHTESAGHSCCGGKKPADQDNRQL